MEGICHGAKFVIANKLRYKQVAASSSDPTGMPVTSGLTYRWQAGMGVTQSGGLVTAWNDQAGTNHVYSSGYSPTYVSSFDRFNYKPSVKFSAGKVLAGTALTPFYGNTDRTVVVICRTLAAGDATYGDNIISNSDAPIARYNANSWPYYNPVAISTRGIHGWDPQPDSLPSEQPVKATQCIVWAHNSTGTLSTLRRNGTQVLSTSLNFTENQGYTVIGKGMQNAGHDIDADYADILVFNRVLSGSEISQIEAWAISYYGIDIYFDKVSLLLHCDGANGSTTFTDSSPNALTVTTYGSAQISTSRSQFGGASGLFNGTTDGIKVTTTNSTFSGDFTWEGWFYPTSTTTSYKLIFAAGSEATGRYNILQYGSKMVVDLYTIAQDINVDCGIVANSGWHHVALARSGSTVTLYYDGVAKATATRSGTVGNSNGFYCGKNSSSGDLFLGNLDEIRITNGVARYTANFTVPSAPFPNS